MSDGLTPAHSSYAAHGGSVITPVGERRDWGVLVRALIVVLLWAAMAVAAGYLWRELWTAPKGVVYGGTWYPDPVAFETSLRTQFGAEAWFTLVTAGVAVVTGALTAWLFNRAEVLGLLVALAGSALVVFVTFTVGEALSPPDPSIAAATAADGTELVGQLTLDLDAPDDEHPLGRGWPVLLVAPMGALLAVGFIYLGTTRRVPE